MPAPAVPVAPAAAGRARGGIQTDLVGEQLEGGAGERGGVSAKTSRKLRLDCETFSPSGQTASPLGPAPSAWGAAALPLRPSSAPAGGVSMAAESC